MKPTLWIIIGIVIGALALAFFVRIPSSNQKKAAISIGKTNINLEVADTDVLRTQGLSGRESLASTTGMLFVFDESDTYGFWMKDMRFPLDIIWLDEQGVVVHIEYNVAPETYPSVLTPNEKALYVLEVNAGVASELLIEKGTRLDIVFK
ncbi:DUF192 domain-containing protein [Candidatus Campbellbacteria bacterium]|nr:MAG: DUF192 domain-containing protein [Candidatus Campbellbacteria bacterium]